MASRHSQFSPALFDFLRELRAHNNREWFQRNKVRYEADVRAPSLQFITDVAQPLRRISRHLVADPRPVGGSLFRINRDIRFSSDKSPYKTAVGMSFGHDHGRDVPAPGFYLHLEAGQSFVGGGVHMPDTPTLNRVRDAIVTDTGGWRRVVDDPDFAPAFTLMGDALKRAPQGYDPSHPYVEHLKRKSYVWHVAYSEAEVCGPDFMDRFIDSCRMAAPFTRFLAKALDAAW